MKVVIDISPLKSGHKTRGIGMYTRRLIDALHRVDKKDQFILTTKANEIPDADIIHYPYFDLFFHTLPLRKKTPTIVTVHDVTPLLFPKDFPIGVRGKAGLWIQKQSLRSADAIITDSKNSKLDIIRLLQVNPKKIRVVYLAAGDEFQPASQSAIKLVRKKYRLPESFVLYVGDVNPNKNLERLLKAFRKVADRFAKLHLVLVGRAFANKDLPQVKVIRGWIEKLELTNRVAIQPNVPLDPADDLVAIYSAAALYIQPSLYEGFGLPVLEAYACATPVVAAKVASIPEIAGDAAIFIDPTKTASIENGMKKALNLGSAERDRLTEKAKKQAKEFSWEETARKTIMVYRDVATTGE